MATNNEIEFKQILTKDLYDKIFNTYFKNEKPFSQTNYYIDTKGFKLRDHRSALRIRVKDNSYEMTLKVPAEVGLMEYNHPTNVKLKMNDTLSNSKLPDDIRNIIEGQFNVSEDELIILGDLTTLRVETHYQNELLVLDKSEYLNKVDYELEFEVDSYNEGYEKFKQLLQEFDIKHEKPLNKVQRFFEEKQNASNK
ncbi:MULTISPECIES: CYTH domain-containing protein [Staphylococcus]|uniref:CYTH domain-containing protein n=1 Tax=Staphylococcus TaxID=1279 RepID=UPI0001EF4BF0|nr:MULTISPECIES: CYTH domain-containing protein [Staphylococcus]EFS17111.1 adenylate cyclase [Staphylococcus capitis C87]MBC3048302.1 CYTH domain-containing protein [Staphylococcus capitis]MBC3068911.1 CYTH domain-containing protein [Staphylococcus capitis]MBC3071097.1 CYTH domain-containing protein [Staphylococcus capitis]MBC3081396.1 CYTH domain-containing protein [Staphylococcus capitis]